MVFLDLSYTQSVLKSKTWLGLCGAGILGAMVLCSSAVFAFSGIPNRADRFVNDTARIINASDEAAIRAALQNTRATTGDEITVATIDSQKTFSSGAESWEQFSTRWFNTWRIGSSKTNRGVLLLVALKDRKVRVELGTGFSKVYDKVMQCVIVLSMIPRFKQDDYSTGILNGTNAVIRAIQAKYAPCPVPFTSVQQPVAKPKPQITTQPQVYTRVKPPTSSDIKPVARPVLRDTNVPKPKPATLPLEWLFGGCGVLILFSLGRGLFRPKVKKCEQCGNAMQKLDEQSDNEYLEDGQKLEEVLKSVNYDVWQCSACNHRSIVRHVAWFSSYGNCPSCSRQTLWSDREILIAPSYHFSGQDRVLRRCKHCQFQDSHVIITPQLEHDDHSSTRHHGIGSFDSDDSSTRHSAGFTDNSSSSSSSSDDSSDSGGSSSGGGASGSW
jgi:uncharacterized protein